MQGLRTISVAVMVAALGVSVLGLSEAGARSLYDADHPAEFPPASYKGLQYVDSRGCAYVRAGSGGAVQWVPRVSRDRRVLCGFKPTLAQTEKSLPVIPDPVGATPNTVAAAIAKPVPQSGAPVAPVSVSAENAPKPQQPSLPPLAQLAGKTVGERGCVASVADGQVRCATDTVEYILKRLPAGVTVRTADGRRMTTTEPTLVRVPVKRAAPMPAPIMVATTAPANVAPTGTVALTQCGGLSGNAAQYLNTNGRYAVRCGPQAVHPSAYIQQRVQLRLSTQSANQQAVARAAGIEPYALPRPVVGTLPEGYSRAWTDGRLNPNRGPQTARGDLQMAQVWTQTTPAYDLYTPRRKTFWEWLFGTPVKTRAVTVQAPYYAPQGEALVQISTKSVAPARTPTVVNTAVAQVQKQQQAQALRYVQVGTFGVPENAERSIARLSAMGYPVSSQILRRGGKPLKIVLAGPFARPEQTLSALSAVRGAGYGDAFARK
ncbi:SPOR domain-containing protein [Celeribacter sp. PS-C1]|uniref:SPOR domain-containing protein n=1 Tax=Celeribacter sp. PS-C1 TaxID=2820813 RepID=UPI001C66564A|nr:SPOR domain-containing protein [Celeribacter sp. PS-C1]MBW6418357.1 SPOR domain-containing protein [Celeribacter sp. PS-C1]